MINSPIWVRAGIPENGYVAHYIERKIMTIADCARFVADFWTDETSRNGLKRLQRWVMPAGSEDGEYFYIPPVHVGCRGMFNRQTSVDDVFDKYIQMATYNSRLSEVVDFLGG